MPCAPCGPVGAREPRRRGRVRRSHYCTWASGAAGCSLPRQRVSRGYLPIAWRTQRVPAVAGAIGRAGLLIRPLKIGERALDARALQAAHDEDQRERRSASGQASSGSRMDDVLDPVDQHRRRHAREVQKSLETKDIGAVAMDSMPAQTPKAVQSSGWSKTAAKD